jgi:hypothetical protein
MVQFTVDGEALSRGIERRLRIGMKSNWNLKNYISSESKSPGTPFDPVEI